MTVLASFNWGSGPKIPLTFAYERQRSGADMQYRVQVTVGTLSTDTSYFGYPIYMKLTIGGVLRETTTLKAASPNQWGSPITYTSPWYTISNLTSGSAVVSFNMYSGSGCTRNDTFSYSMAVDPAASRLSAPAGTLGTGLVLSVTKYNSSFTHTISWVCGSAKGDVCVQASDPSITWDAAHGNTVALASQNTAGQSVTVSFIITTYSGSSVVGTDSASCVMAIPAGVKPSVTVSVSDAAGLFATYGAYIQGHSRLAITANPQTAHGSPITGYAITADGHSYYYNPVTTEVLQNTGNLRITAVVTDARTRPSEPGTADITVLEYARPSVTVNAYRCNEAGNADQEGEYMKVGFNASITSLNGKNSASYTIKYNQSGGSVKTITGKGLSYLSDKISCDKTTAWEVEVTVSDNLTSSVKSAVIPIAFTLLEFYKTGKGVSLGKVATRDGFDCAMTAYFSGATNVSGALTATGAVAMPSGMTIGGSTIGDFVVAQGKIDMWTYRKWNSGLAECWGKKLYTEALTTPWGVLYESRVLQESFINGLFMETPITTISAAGHNGAVMIEHMTDGNANLTPEWCAVRPMSTPSVMFYITYYAFGRWK